MRRYLKKSMLMNIVKVKILLMDQMVQVIQIDIDIDEDVLNII